MTNFKDAAEKAVEAAKRVLEQAADATKDVAEKAIEATQEKTMEAVDISKELAQKAADAIKAKETASDAASRLEEAMKKVG